MRKALYRPEHSSTVAQKGIADSNTLDLSCCGANAKEIVVPMQRQLWLYICITF